MIPAKDIAAPQRMNFTGDTGGILDWQIGFENVMPGIVDGPVNKQTPPWPSGENHLNFLSFGKVDEQAEAAKAYAQVVTEFPFSEKMDCTYINVAMQNIDAKIKAVTEARAAGTTDRVGARYLAAYNTRKTEFQTLANKMDCVGLQEKQDTQEFLDTQDAQLDKAKKAATDTSRTATYIVWGVLGLAGLVTMIILIRK